VDLRIVHELTRKPGPFATAYIDASHDTEDAAQVGRLRWNGARGELADRGADEATLAALDAAVADGDTPVGRAGRVLVARGGEVLLDRLLREPPAAARVSWGAVPDLLPLLIDQGEPVTAVVVSIDDTGGEILLARPGSGPEPVGEKVTADPSGPVHKVRGGGWAHLRMQHRVEETWRRNTAAVAEQIDTLVAGTAARVVVIVGETQSTSRLREALGERASAIAVDAEVNASAGSEELEEAVEAAVLDVVDADRHAALERLDLALGRDEGLAVHGVEPVLAALRATAVETLFLDADVAREGSVWITDMPTALATREDQLRAMGAEPVQQIGVDEALLRAAAASDAAFTPLGGGRSGLVGRPVDDGVAAILRFPLPEGT
jgi:hypothetical protein